MGALAAPHGVYWETLGSVGRLWEPLGEVAWSSGIGWGSIFWIGFIGQGLDPRLGVQVLDWGLSAGGCLGPGWGSGVQVTGGDPGRDLSPWRNLDHRWRSGPSLDCGVPWPRWDLVLTGGFGSWAVVWVLHWGLELRWGLGSGWGSRSWNRVWAPGGALDGGNGSGSWVGVQVLG